MIWIDVKEEPAPKDRVIWVYGKICCRDVGGFGVWRTAWVERPLRSRFESDGCYIEDIKHWMEYRETNNKPEPPLTVRG